MGRVRRYVGDNSYHFVNSVFMQVFTKRLNEKWGKVPLCNECADRAPHIRGFCFPFCWRCCGFISGVLGAFILKSYLKCEGFNSTTVVFGSVLIIPCLVDYVLQNMTVYTSNNYKRAIFGLCAGFGTRFLVYEIFNL